jgi:limonene 1,2-monooxygenase
MRMTFGIFLAPFHRLGENPPLAIERDFKLIELLDELGYDEAWVGEHHSAGWETIASPEVFIGVAAQRTRHIKLGTGVVSLPYHHPLMVANRMVLLDNITRGRVMLGVGPGALYSDALMLGIEPTRQREMMAESLDAIMELLTSEEPVTRKTDWFTLNDARLHLQSYTQPHLPVVVASVQSPAGVQLAGKYGAGVLTIGTHVGFRGPVDLKGQWKIAEETAAQNGKTMRRDQWRLTMPIHLSDSRKQALADVREYGGHYWVEYMQKITGFQPPEGPRDQIIEKMVEAGSAVVGTPDDLIATIEQFQETTGGFGGVLNRAHEWTTWEKTRYSYELLARYVMPRFQGSLRGVEASYNEAHAQLERVKAATKAAIERAHESYEHAAEAKPART